MHPSLRHLRLAVPPPLPIRRFRVTTALFRWCLFAVVPLHGALAAILNVPAEHTFVSAIAAAQAGDTIVVADGVYNEPVVIDGASGEPGAPITLRAANRSQAIFEGLALSSNAKIEIARAHWVVEGFHFRDIVTNDRVSVVRFKGATNGVLRHCSFVNCGTTSPDNADQANTHAVVMTSGASSNIVERCSFQDIPAVGFHVINTGSDINNRDNVFRYNLFTGNIAVQGGFGDSNSIRIGTGTDSAANNPTNALIEHNLWQDVVSTQVAIYLKCGHNTIQHNTFRNTAVGITSRRGSGVKFIGNYFLNGGGIRVRDTGHLISHNYIEGVVALPTQGDDGIQAMAGQTQSPGANSGHVAAGDSTFENNTIVDIGQAAFIYGQDWQANPNTGQLRCKNVAPNNNVFRRNLFVSDAGEAIRRTLRTGSLCDSSLPALCPDDENIWSENVVWFHGSGAAGYTPDGVTAEDPQLVRDTFNNLVASVAVGGVAAADYGAHPPFRPLTVADVGPGSIYVADANNAPSAQAQSVSTDEDAPIAITLAGTDQEGEPLAYNVLTAPAHGALSGTAPNLVYSPAANYYGADSFTFAVSDGALESAPATVSITVVPVNDAPVANAESIEAADGTAKPVTLTGTDAEGSALTYSVLAAPANGTLSGTAPNLTYTPNEGFTGADSFTFKASDGELDSAPATVSIAVVAANTGPSANAQSATTAEDTSVTLTLHGVTASQGGGNGNDGGNGNSNGARPVIVIYPANGVLSGTPPTVTYTPNPNFHGLDSFMFRPNDRSDNAATARVDIVVTPVNDAPVAAAQNATTPEDTSQPIVLSGVDVDGDALTYTVVAGPSHGTLSGTAPNLVYAPAANFHGNDSLTFKVGDGTLESAAATVSIAVTPVNDAPVAQDQSVALAEDTTAPITVVGTDVDGGSLIYTLVTPPAHGILLGGSPNYFYRPAADYNGPDSFSFRVSDGTLASAPATVSITVEPVNDAPIAVAQTVATAPDTAKSITLEAADIDSAVLTFAIVSGPANGVLSAMGGDMVTYTPNAGFAGTDSFTFVASDGALVSEAATVTIIVAEEDVTAGLVGWWKFNEPSGTVAADSSGNNFTATFQNGANLSGGVANLAGGTQVGRVSHNALLKPASFSVSIWAKANASTSMALFKSAGGDGFGSGFAILQNSSGAVFFRWGRGTGSNGSLTHGGVPAAQLRHIVVTYDPAPPATMRLYVDGNLVGSDNTVLFGYGATNTSPQFIGDSNGFANYNGQLDDLRVYDRALTDAEVVLLNTNGPR